MSVHMSSAPAVYRFDSACIHLILYYASRVLAWQEALIYIRVHVDLHARVHHFKSLGCKVYSVRVRVGVVSFDAASGLALIPSILSVIFN